MQVYVWRIAIGIVLGYFGTWVLAIVVSVATLLYRIPQIISCIKKGEIYYSFGIFFTTKALSFLLPLWLTVLLVNGDLIIAYFSSHFGTDFSQLFIRTH